LLTNNSKKFELGLSFIII